MYAGHSSGHLSTVGKLLVAPDGDGWGIYSIISDAIGSEPILIRGRFASEGQAEQELRRLLLPAEKTPQQTIQQLIAKRQQEPSHWKA